MKFPYYRTRMLLIKSFGTTKMFPSVMRKGIATIGDLLSDTGNIVRVFTQDNHSVHCTAINGVLHIELIKTRIQFCGGRKPESPEKTLKVRLRSTETQSTYNIVVEVEGVIDVHCTSLTSIEAYNICLLYTSPSPRDLSTSRMPSSA